MTPTPNTEPCATCGGSGTVPVYGNEYGETVVCPYCTPARIAALETEVAELRRRMEAQDADT